METNKKNFKLSKVSYKSGQLYVEYTTQTVIASENHSIESKQTFEVQPHVDLTDVLERYKPFIATVFYYDKLSEQDLIDEVMSKISVRGVKFSGSDKTKGIVISGTLLSINNRAMAINSENIKYNSSRYGFEDSFEELEEKLVEEVYQFIFEGKKGQLSMFSEAETSGGELFEDAEEVEEDAENAAEEKELAENVDLDDAEA